MTCQECQEYTADYLTQTLPAGKQPEFAAHLGQCAACREQVMFADEVWQKLAHVPLPDAEPSPAVRERFYEMLNREAPKERPSLRAWLTHVFPAWRPALQVAGATAMLAVGWFGNTYYHKTSGTPATPEVAQLRQQVDQMQQLVALSLLQQQSASERLKGVNWSYRVAPANTQMVSALINTVQQDSSVNVRLAAVDALQKFSDNASVRQALIQALPREESPMVQVAIIDLLTQLRDRNSVPALQQLSKDKSVDPAVRDRAGWGVRQIE